MLERRLDNMVYRMHFATSRKAARQLVLHGHIRVNGRKVGIPSYLVREGDEIDVQEQAKKIVSIKDSLKEFSRSGVSPGWKWTRTGCGARCAQCRVGQTSPTWRTSGSS